MNSVSVRNIKDQTEGEPGDETKVEHLGRCSTQNTEAMKTLAKTSVLKAFDGAGRNTQTSEVEYASKGHCFESKPLAGAV